MTYQPKTTKAQRDGLKQFFAATKSGDAHWWTDEAADAVVDDLAACESALAEEQRKNAELGVRIAKLIEAGDAMYIYGDFTRSYFSVDSDWSKLTTNLPQPPERSV